VKAADVSPAVSLEPHVLNPFRVSCARALTLCAFLPLIAACGRNTAAAAGQSSGRGRGGDGGAVPVVTAAVSKKDVPVEIAAIGNVEAYANISVRSQVTGVVKEIYFHEGDTVHEGDKIFAIDARPYEAQLEQARANAARDQALLTQAEAQLNRDTAEAKYTQITAERNSALTDRGIVAKDASEQAHAAADAAGATVNADRAAIESARAELAAQQAAVDNAKVELDYTVIRAPLSGRTGSIAVKAGGLVTANSTEMTTIAEIAPVYVTFSVPALHLTNIKTQMNKGPLTVVAAPQDAGAVSTTGTLAFIDNAVDISTDTIKLKAKFDNTDRTLWPGQFARVNLRLTTLNGATVVSSEAVQTGQDGQFVFLVKPDATVEQRPITVGQRVAQDVVIDKGLKPGDIVVTEGQLRLEPGTHVQVPGSENQQGQGRGQGGRGGRGGRGRESL
jgi:multidrug efflux system membrane fusion protein